jgi:hypothetical protein
MSADCSAFLRQISTRPLDPKEFIGNKDKINQALLRLATNHMEGMLVVSGSKLATRYERMSLSDTKTIDIADQIAELVNDRRLYNDFFYTVRRIYF